jgi:hypothetical protein
MTKVMAEKKTSQTTTDIIALISKKVAFSKMLFRGQFYMYKGTRC